MIDSATHCSRSSSWSGSACFSSFAGRADQEPDLEEFRQRWQAEADEALKRAQTELPRLAELLSSFARA